MRKKYLSALLFGALLVASTGTFTSCKDYDDDINNLQEQITSNKDAIAALQKLVSEGKWVTSISPIENGFTVTMSDGTTQNITGINGEDGKPGTVISLDPTTNNWIIDGVDTGICAKGEKGDQGDQGEQGPAGEDGAQGAQGEPGKNAPSPQIDPETGNWIVYAWDEATGDYKATVTDIYAQAAKIFVTEKEGFIELNVDGVAYLLPTTSDAYTVEAPYHKVVVTSEYAEWNPTTSDVNYQALLKLFPEIGEIEKGTRLTQGGELPVLVTPANIDLTDGFKFSVQHVTDGIVEGITLSNPTKGLSDAWKIEGNKMSRSASAADCYWTLQVEQALVKNTYAEVTDAALVVENANGKVVKTPFAYTIAAPTEITKTVKPSIEGSGEATYSSEIDLFTSSVEGKKAPIVFKNEFEGKYIIKLADQLQVEKYGLEIVDGHKLVIKNPGSEVTIPVELDVTVLGLNGLATKKTVTVEVTNAISATEGLSAQNIVLSTKKIGTDYAQYVTWKFDELNLATATQKNTFLKTNSKQITVYKDGEIAKKSDGTNAVYDLKVLDANGVGTSDYEAAKTIRFTLPSKDLLPGDYQIVLTASNINGTNETVVYKSETSMSIANPAAEDIFKLASGYVDADGIMQAVGTSDGKFITFDLTEGIVAGDFANANPTFVDVDQESWTGASSWGKVNWINNNLLYVAVENSTTDEGKNHLYKTRNIRATYALFGNDKNTIEFPFEVEVVSPVYSTKPTSVVKVDATKLTLDGKEATSVDIATITKATLAAGINAGDEYKLFTTDNNITTVYYPLNDVKAVNEYVQKADGTIIQFSAADLALYTTIANLNDNAGRYTSDDIVKASQGTKYYLLTDVFNVLRDYLYQQGILMKKNIDNIDYYSWVNLSENEEKALTNDQKNARTLFKSYYTLCGYSYQNKTETTSGTSTSYSDKYLKEQAVVQFVDAEEAAKYAVLKGTTVTRQLQSGVDMPAGQVKVAMQIVVKDKWGMTMKVPFDVIIKQ